jgi:amino acid adenylation domain-containing protein
VLAAVALNGVFCILDPSYPAARLKEMVQFVSAKTLLCVGDPKLWSGEFLKAARNEFGPKLIEAGRFECPEAVPKAGALHGIDTAGEGSMHAGYHLFTSGSTGRPKAIFTDLLPLTHFIHWHVRTFRMGESDRFTMLSGLGHDPILRDIFTPLCAGGTLCVPPQGAMTSPRSLLAWMKAERVSVSHLTPQLVRLLHQQARHENDGQAVAPYLEALRCAFFGGDSLTFADLRSWKEIAPNATCVNFYGATETPQAVGYYVVDDHTIFASAASDGARVPVGRGIADVQLLLLRQGLELAPIGQEGEIFVRTAFLSRGYVGDPPGTADRFLPNPYTNIPGDSMYRTGDRGRFLEDGTVEYVGRVDDQVKVRGFRVETSEVELKLMGLQFVENAVVVAVPHSVLGSQLVAFVVAKHPALPATPNPAHLAEHLRMALFEQLPDYMVPTRIQLLDQLPLTPNAKVDRSALRTLAARAEGDNAAPESPRTKDVHSVVRGIWERWLGARNISNESDFLFLGGNSLMAVSMSLEIEEQTQVTIDPSSLFELRTLGRFCEHIMTKLAQRSELQPCPAIGCTSASSRNRGGSDAVNGEEMLLQLRKRVEECRGSARREPAAARVNKKPYAMRESVIAKAFLAPLYQVNSGMLRALASRLILKLEGGQWYSLTLRRLYKAIHNMDIGHYSSSCFSVGNFKPGTTFGRYCDVTSTARFETANHPANTISTHGVFYHKGLGFSTGVSIPRTRIVVGNDVHIGHNAVLLHPAARIGHGAIIAAGAVVTSDVPPYAIVAGYPARVVRYRFSEPIIRELCAIRWWELSLEELRPVRSLFERPIEGDEIR